MSKTFLALFGGLVLAGMVLILSIPYLFAPHQPHQELITAVAGGLFVVLAVIVIVFKASWQRTLRAKTNQ